jgi:hypothetical protein
MSGFFESLASRARGEALAVRPRLPGLFESAPGQLFEKSEVFTIVERPAPERPTHTAVPPAEVRVISNAPDRVVTAPAPTPVPAPPPAPPGPTAPTLAAEPLRTLLVVSPPPPMTSREDVLLPTPVPIEVAPDRSWRDDPPPAAARRAPVQRSRDGDATHSVTIPAPAAPPPALAPPPRPSPREVVPRMARARPQLSQPAPPPRQEETTVYVSIGRIEVRAVQPPPETRPRESAKSAVMSLDEYLQSRRERR